MKTTAIKYTLSLCMLLALSGYFKCYAQPIVGLNILAKLKSGGEFLTTADWLKIDDDNTGDWSGILFGRALSADQGRIGSIWSKNHKDTNAYGELVKVNENVNIGVIHNFWDTDAYPVFSFNGNGILTNNGIIENINAKINSYGTGSISLIGNVGIGTSTPAAPLDIYNTTANARTSIFARGADPGFQLGFYNGSGNNENDVVGKLGLSYNGGTPSSFINFHRGLYSEDTYISFNAENNPYTSMSIRGHKVGIGTIYPTSLLEVTAGGEGDIAKFGFDDATANSIGLKISANLANSTNTRPEVLFSLFYGGVEDISMYRLTENHAKFYKPVVIGEDNSTSTPLLLDVHGNAHFNNDLGTALTQVSINTDTLITNAALTVGGPVYIGSKTDVAHSVNAEYIGSYYLWVKGGVVSEDFVVAPQDDWRDIVFNDDYKLPTLNEVEEYVKTNRHLEGIPSEAQVKQKGYNMNVLAKSFLEKIEHLYLYNIDQEKKISTLQTVNANLKSENDKQRQTLSDLEKRIAALEKK